MFLGEGGEAQLTRYKLQAYLLACTYCFLRQKRNKRVKPLVNPTSPKHPPIGNIPIGKHDHPNWVGWRAGFENNNCAKQYRREFLFYVKILDI